MAATAFRADKSARPPQICHTPFPPFWVHGLILLSGISHNQNFFLWLIKRDNHIFDFSASIVVHHLFRIFVPFVQGIGLHVKHNSAGPGPGVGFSAGLGCLTCETAYKRSNQASETRLSRFLHSFCRQMAQNKQVYFVCCAEHSNLLQFILDFRQFYPYKIKIFEGKLIQIFR